MRPGAVLLPPHSEPVHYAIAITPNLQTFTFTGSVTIDLIIHTPTSSLELHSKELSIHSATFTPHPPALTPTVTPAQTTPLVPTTISYNIPMMTVTLGFPSDLPAGPGALTLTFTGSHNDQMAGFYRSTYVDRAGKKQTMASTQFEALDARRCFPCWDEPSRKATFSLTLTVPKGRTAFSNMPEEYSAENEDGSRTITFMKSPKMSTYLLAIVLGEFDFVQKMTKHGVLVRVYTPPGKVEQGKFALQVGCDALDFYDDFFKVPYPLPKLDMVAIPEFAAGAMENWGLVTYREVDVLIDPIKASSSQRQRVCTVVAHELAHQWFGNLVTMAWWDDLWLNEGFASFMQNFCADFLFPEWHMWPQSVGSDQSAALRLDGLRTSHPIQVPIHHAKEVEQVFDAISYSKGGCVVRMIYAVLGYEKFRLGLENYMKKHAYGNTQTNDLWDAWSNASGQDINALTGTWTEQMGYPLLKVINEEFAGESAKLHIEQLWFLADGSAPANDEERKKLWTIPLFYSTAANPLKDNDIPPFHMFNSKTTHLNVELRNPADWVKLNAGQYVPLRVMYGPEMTSRLLKAVRNLELSAADRTGLLNDIFALAKAGHVDGAYLLRAVSAYVNENHSSVWGMVESVLIALDKTLLGVPRLSQKFRALAGKVVAKGMQLCGWDPKTTDGHLDTLLRETLINLSGTFADKDEATLAEARKRYAAVIANPSSMAACPSDYRVTVYKLALKTGGKKEYDELRALEASFSDTAEKKQVYHAIGAAPSDALKIDALQWAISGSIKLQDFFYVFGSVSSVTSEGLHLTWKFFKDNFEKIRNMLRSASPSLMAAVIVMSCGGFNKTEDIDEVEKFFKEHPVPDCERRISQLIESMRINASFLQALERCDLSDEFWDSLLQE